MDKQIILKTLVGSRASGLADPDSDFDYRGVYVTPTEQILSLGHHYKGSSWVEGDVDSTSWEIGHFLNLATKCNPTILEVFKAPRVLLPEDASSGEEWNGIDFGKELRDLFPYVWNPRDAFNAFVGYGCNQRTKLLKKEEFPRAPKYAVAYIRTLVNLHSLLSRGDFSLEIPEGPLKDKLLDIKKGNFTVGEIIDYTNEMTKRCAERLEECKHQPDLSKVNDFLLKVRKEFWNVT